LKIRTKIAGALLALGLAGGTVALAAPEASASNLLNVPHTHQGTCPVNDCWTWILANGAVIRGNTTLLQSQYNYVLVVCSQKQASGWKISPLGPWGPFNNDGWVHPYCVSPYDANGVRWNQYP